MKLGPNDPRLTAYVLGELTADDRALVESAAAQDTSIAAEIEDIRRLTVDLAADLQREPLPELDPAQRRRVLAGTPPAHAAASATGWANRRWAPSRRFAVAASFLLVFGGLIVSGVGPRLVLWAVISRHRADAVSSSEGLQRSFAPPLSLRDALLGRGEYFEDSGSLSRTQSDAQSPGYRLSSDALALGVPTMPMPPVLTPPGLAMATPPPPPPRTGGGDPHAINESGGLVAQPTALFSLMQPTPEASDPYAPMVPEGEQPFDTEDYNRVVDNPFLAVTANPLSTFSIDVDTASYANVRRFLTSGALPPKDAVRIEELVNYFAYDYAPPSDDLPFAVHLDVAEAPWEPTHRLVRIGLKGREVAIDRRPPSNLVFLVDVSGSMDEPNKLPLVQDSLRLLVEQLSASDRVAMVVYAGASGLVLPPTAGSDKRALLEAIERLRAGGSTNGGEGIQLAYDTAAASFISGGTNRVVLATDGDFNVGITDEGSLTRLIEAEAKRGIFLSVLGYGMGNYNDAMLEQLADQGNGNYAYIDRLSEAQKVLVEEMSGTLLTIAKDVKIQVEFNPAKVSAYRLIGYENRLLAAEDFNDDTKDAGEIGAGHTVTALYEVVPVGVPITLPGVDPLKYQSPGPLSWAADGVDLLTVKLRYKAPEGDTSQLIEAPLVDRGGDMSRASADFQFAASVAAFGMLLRDSPYRGAASWEGTFALADAGRGFDASGRQAEFMELVRQAASLAQVGATRP